MVALRFANLAAKALLLCLLLYAVLRPELPQFQGKAMGVRLLTFGLPTVIVPLVWLLRLKRTRRTYPHHLDFCLVLPFLMDTGGNTLNLYDRVTWFDDAMHFATWVPWVLGFGFLLHYAPELPRWAHLGLVVGFGAVTHILWELGEYVAFVRKSPELTTAYTDTLGDLLLSLCGSIFGAVITVTALWDAGRAAPGSRSNTPAN